VASRPLVSVIIPVYNGDRYLTEAIESVLAQDYSPIEIIVVDDGSTDNTALVAQQYASDVRYVHQANQGTSVARNHGVGLAKGDLIAFLGADDVWMDDKLVQQVQTLSAESSLEAVFGQVQQFYSPDLTQAERDRIVCSSEPMAGHLPSAMLLTRSAFARVGPFDPTLLRGEFIDWYARFAEVGIHSQMLPTVVARRRLHRANKGHSHRQYNADLIFSLKASLDRRRAAALRKSQ